MATPNFLIGRGELLTTPISAPGGGAPKKNAYTVEESKQRLKRQAADTAESLRDLPDRACPRGLAVAKIALHPGYIAKSYFPTAFMRALGIESVGSREIRLIPKKWTKKGEPIECTTTEIFVAGDRDSFSCIPDLIDSFQPEDGAGKDLVRIEQINPFGVAERFRSSQEKRHQKFEVALHLLPSEDSSFIKLGFLEYADELGIKAFNDLTFEVGNLWFLPIEGSDEAVQLLTQYAFVRVVRPVPELRGIRPEYSARRSNVHVSCSLPKTAPVSSDIKVAILDGGLPEDHCIEKWLGDYRVMDERAADLDDSSLNHGLAVTSAFLFGSIDPAKQVSRPYAYADHLRVLDSGSNYDDPLELYRTLGFIEEVLLSRRYEFLNLSLGPELPIEDDEVHAWTSVIDEYLKNGDTFLTVAAGNNGEQDWESGNARVQVPSDCVNAVTVGAADSTEETWDRASYSAVGPGRRPGVIKPDVLGFGGSPRSYFHVLGSGGRPSVRPEQGTSFAAPLVLRNAVGIKALLGEELSPLAIRALLVHASSQSGRSLREVGWGKIPEDIMEVISCRDGVARTVYQGDLKPGKYLHAPIPILPKGLSGMVTLKATFCYGSPVDPQDATSYTQAGLDVTFRPHDEKMNDSGSLAKPGQFFQSKVYATEDERRSDLGKWETTLNATRRMRGTSLKNPGFDIHYNAREMGANASNAQRIPYALIVTIEAPNHPDLYSEILKSYTSLIAIQPAVSLPIRV